MLAHWLRAGAGGWRLDVADELPMDFIRELRRREREIDPEAALIGEVWEDPSNKVAYGETRCYCAGDTLDSDHELSAARCGAGCSCWGASTPWNLCAAC